MAAINAGKTSAPTYQAARRQPSMCSDCYTSRACASDYAVPCPVGRTLHWMQRLLPAFRRLRASSDREGTNPSARKRDRVPDAALERPFRRHGPGAGACNLGDDALAPNSRRAALPPGSNHAASDRRVRRSVSPRDLPVPLYVFPTAESFDRASDERLRATGLSANKMRHCGASVTHSCPRWSSPPDWNVARLWRQRRYCFVGLLFEAIAAGVGSHTMGA